MEQLAKFILGGLAGYLWESVYAPHLKGTLPGVPFRPIYGVGAAIASKDFDRNFILSICAEQLGNKNHAWHYDTTNPLAVNENVKLPNNVLFGVAMTKFAELWESISGPIR